MSTSYYLLRRPITSVRPEVLGGHTHVGVWINHAKSGDLVVRNEEWLPLLQALTSDECVIHVSCGGKDVGLVVDDRCPESCDMVQIVSECGTLHSMGEIRNQQTMRET